jgi:hypothetical protein
MNPKKQGGLIGEVLAYQLSKTPYAIVKKDGTIRLFLTIVTQTYQTMRTQRPTITLVGMPVRSKHSELKRVTSSDDYHRL